MNQADAEDAYLDGLSEVEKFAQQFMLDWYQPNRETFFAVSWANLPPEIKARIQQMRPDLVEQIRKVGNA